MSIILLVSVTSIACNMNNVVKKSTYKNTNEKKEKSIQSNGKTIIIDSGHGGRDPGKVGVNNIKEQDINLEIGRKLKEVLSKKGYKVVMTRLDNKDLCEGEKFIKTTELNKRCQIINNAYNQNKNSIMISIHQNSFTNSSVHGAQCFYYESSAESKKLSELVQLHMNEQINTHKSKKAKTNNSYYMLINSKCPGMIIECGFLSNNEEAVKLKNNDYQYKLAQIITTSIDEYFTKTS